MINEEFWNRDINLFEIPKFQCPTCNKGLLLTEIDNKIQATTEESKKSYEATGEPEDYEGKFAAIAICNNPVCKEILTIAGETKVVQSGWDDGCDPDTFEELYPPGPKYETVFEVKFVSPAIKLISLPKTTPQELVNTIDESYKLFWIDEASCGNKIRVAVEKLLDFQKVNKTKINRRGRRESLNLHQRIVQFKSKEPLVADYLLALKWIGNQGSHSGKELHKKDLMKAYKILEFSIHDLYDKSRNEVNKLTSKINKKKRSV